MAVSAMSETYRRALGDNEDCSLTIEVQRLKGDLWLLSLVTRDKCHMKSDSRRFNKRVSTRVLVPFKALVTHVCSSLCVQKLHHNFRTAEKLLKESTHSPDGPTIATFCPAVIVKLKLLINGSFAFFEPISTAPSFS